MEPDIAKVLSYEIKKELAERYFGFRKLIEEDKEALARKVRRQTLTIEQKICLDLARIYILLHDETLIQAFLDMTGLEEEFFYDPYLVESSTIRQRVFEGVKARGFTRARRFNNLVLDGYAELVAHVEEYREKFGELYEDQEVIKEEIKLFYQKNNLGDIMGFLRSLESSPVMGGGLEGGVQAGSAQRLEKKMQVEPPRPIEQLLPVFPPLMPLRTIKRKLKKLTRQAFLLHAGGFQVNAK